MSSQLLILALFLGVALGAAIETNQSNNVNGATLTGEHVPMTDYPFVLPVIFQERQQCFGVLYSENYVLTSAQCLKNVDVNIMNFRVLVKNEHVEVERVFVHECFDELTNNHDLALLKLKTPVTQIAPVQIHDKYFGEATGNGIVLGYDHSLTKAFVNVVPLGKCSDYFDVTFYQLCISQKVNMGYGNCVATPGLPFMQIQENGKIVLSGLVSYSSDACVRTPTVVTNVNKYEQWIYNKVNGLNKRPVC